MSDGYAASAMAFRAIADAGMDRLLHAYHSRARRSGDERALADAERALRIRANPKFMALVDIIDILDIPPAACRRRPDRTAAVAALLDTAAIQLEPDTTRRGAMAAAKTAIRVILDELGVDEDHVGEVTRQILIMARDWARARHAQKTRAKLYARTRTAEPATTRP